MPYRVLDESKKRTERIMFALSKDERDRLERVCLTLDLSMSAVIRGALAAYAKKNGVG